MLSYDQIPAERRIICDASGPAPESSRAIHVASATLSMPLASSMRPEVRRAANTAMAAIDAMLGQLHALRSRLVSEIRASDDASASRIDAMLAHCLPA